jgi:chitodextrinase
LTLTWSAATDNVGVAGYRVYRDGALVASSAGTSASLSGLSPSTLYSFTVAALDAAGNASAQSAPLPVTTPDTTAPSTPTGLSVSALTQTFLTLTWSPATDNVGVSRYEVYRDGALVSSTAGSSVSLSGLSPSTLYSFTVAALDAAGNASAQSAPLPVTTPADTTAPSTPTGLAASALSQTSLTVTWSAATDNVGVAGYRVYRDAALVASPAGTSVSLTGLSPSTLYSFTVAALDAAGNASAQSAALAVTTLADTTAPSTPTDLTASALTQSSLTLTWSAATDDLGVAGYRVYRDATLVASTAGTSTSLNGLAPSTLYTFTVAALDAAGNASAQSAPLPVTTPDTTAPSTPTDLTASGLTATSLTLTWSAATDNVGVASYRVYRDGALVASPAGSSVSLSGLSPSTLYSFTVAALDAAGNASAQSAPLPVTTPDTTAPSTPTSLSASALTATSLTLTWSAATDDVGVSSYRVYRDGALVASSAGTSASLSGLSPSTAYSFSVAALDAAGNVSAQSAPLAVTTPSDTTAPLAPTGLTTSALTATSLTLAWSAASDNVGVTGYRVYRSGTLITSPTGTSTSLTGLSPSTAYSFTVAAVDAAGNVSAQSVPLSVTTQAPAVSLTVAGAPNLPLNGTTTVVTVGFVTGTPTRVELSRDGRAPFAVYPTDSFFTLSADGKSLTGNWCISSACWENVGGTHVLNVKATYAGGATATASVTLNVADP